MVEISRSTNLAILNSSILSIGISMKSFLFKLLDFQRSLSLNVFIIMICFDENWLAHYYQILTTKLLHESSNNN